MLSGMRTRGGAAIVAAALLVGACTNRAPELAPTTSAATDGPTTSLPTQTTTTEPEPAVEMFGTMESPCGPGEATIEPTQNGGATLRLGTATDHGFEAVPGLNVEMLDAAQAFAGWCNDQGGIQGLPIEIVDLDGRMFDTPGATERACAEVFAMVGGGLVFDDQMFPRFHECGMVSFPGFTVTPAAAMADAMVQPLPNPPTTKAVHWYRWAMETHPEAVRRTAIMYTADVQTLAVQAAEERAVMEALGGYEVVDEITYAAVGEANWAPYVQRMKDRDVQALFFVGAPNNLVQLYKAMDEVGYRPELVTGEANFYDSLMVAPGNAELTEGFAVRTAYAPFEEPEHFAGLASYLDMMATYEPDGKIAGLGLQATSAFLLFATAANECIAANAGVLERECVLSAGQAISSWDGGRLHSETNPGSNLPAACGVIMEVRDGAWQRLSPELGSADDDADGWHCDDLLEIAGDFGDLTSGRRPGG
jgi:hypothetical protein